MAALGSQSIASSYEQLLHVDRDGGGNTTTHVSVKDGDNGTTFGFTIASDALMMTSTNRLEFGDTGTYIHQSADGVLDLVSDTEIEINATTIDMNGALDLSGNAQLSGTVTVGADGSGTDVIFYSGTAGDNFSWDASEEKLTITGTNGQTALDVADGNLVVADNVDIEGDIDVNGTTNLDAVDIDGAVQIDAAVTVGADDQGYDFKFFGDTASAYMMWDTSVDDLVFAGAAGIDLDGDIDVNGTANLDNTDIDGTLAVDGTTISLDATTSLNIDNSNTSNGITIGTATSGVPISIGHTTSETTVNDNLVITGNIDANGDSNFQGDITTQSKILIAASGQGIFGAGDPNTGIRWEGSDVLAFDTEGTERFYLDANGTITIDQNENQKSLVIDSEATTNHTLSIEDSVTTEGSIIKATSCNALTNGKILEIHSDSNDNSTRNLVSITNDNTSADNAVGLYIKQDGADASIELAGNGSIKFPGTQGASADANSLDDYEEGTQVVTLGMGSGSLSLLGSKNEGQYTKIGRIVHYSGEISCNGSSSQSGTLTLTLPFTVADISDLAERTVGTCSLQNCNFTDTFDMLHVNTYAGQSVMTITAVTDNAGWNNLDASTWISGTELVWSISYIAA